MELTPEEEKIVFAGLAAAFWDIHAMQDNLTEEEWVKAEVLTSVLQRRIDERIRS